MFDRSFRDWQERARKGGIVPRITYERDLGFWYCNNCGYRISGNLLDTMWKKDTKLPKCPKCHNGKWVHELDYLPSSASKVIE